MLGGVLGGAHAIRLPEVPTRARCPRPHSLSAARSRMKRRGPLSSLSLAPSQVRWMRGSSRGADWRVSVADLEPHHIAWIEDRYRDDFALVARARVAAVAWRARSGQTAEPGLAGDG